MKEEIEYSNNDVICSDCGESLYNKRPQLATWYEETCIKCNETKICTQIRDFKFEKLIIIK